MEGEGRVRGVGGGMNGGGRWTLRGCPSWEREAGGREGHVIFGTKGNATFTDALPMWKCL